MTLRYAVSAALFPASSAAASVARAFEAISEVVFWVSMVFLPFNKCPRGGGVTDATNAFRALG